MALLGEVGQLETPQTLAPQRCPRELEAAEREAESQPALFAAR